MAGYLLTPDEKIRDSMKRKEKRDRIVFRIIVSLVVLYVIFSSIFIVWIINDEPGIKSQKTVSSFTITQGDENRITVRTKGDIGKLEKEFGPIADSDDPLKCVVKIGEKTIATNIGTPYKVVCNYDREILESILEKERE